MNSELSVPVDRREVQEAFWTGVYGTVRKLVTGLLEEVLRLEQQAQVAAGWNERTGARRGYRNGYRRRTLASAYGPLQVNIPRCRGSGLDCSMIFQRYQRRVGDVDRILRHAYVLGASTRGTAKLAEQVFGGSVSHQTISRLMRWLDERLALYRRQPIEPCYPVVYIDGMHVDVVGGDKLVMLVMGLRADGTKEMLGFCLSDGEQCRRLLWNLRRRGLENVELFVSDAAGGIRSALAEVYPEVPWQSCTLHRLMGLREQIGPADYRDAMVRQAGRIFRCPSRLAAVDEAKTWVARWKHVNRWAVQNFIDGLADSLAFYGLPKAWWRRTRTNNALERTIRTLRMRLRPMGCFHDIPAAERAVFGQLLRWHMIPKLTHNT